MGYTLIDMRNERYGRLKVIERSKKPTENKNDKNTYWLCRCDCGKEIVASRSSLLRKNTQSCGCLQKEWASQHEDLTGQVFGRWTVLVKSKKRKYKHGLIQWKCRCSCGTIKTVTGQALRNKQSNSCGCLQKESCVARMLPDGGAAKNKFYREYSNGAKQKGYVFKLSKERFLKITSENCFYCGIPPFRKYFSGTSVYVCNGIDRVNNNIGYITSNVVACCPKCNYAKRDMPKQVFLEWVERIARYQKERNNKN